MSKRLTDMTQGNLWKQIILFSLPLMASNMLQVLFNMADMSVVGHFAEPGAIGAVGSTTALISMFTWFGIGMGSGVNILVARYLGAKDQKSVEDTIHTGIIICFTTGIFVLVLGEILARPLLTVLGTKKELINDAILYFRIYLLGSPAVALYNYGNAILSASGDTRRPLIYLSVSGALNVVLNLVFVIVLDKSVDGVAIASAASQYLSAILILAKLLKSEGLIKLCPRKIHFHKSYAKQLLSLGLSSAIQYSLFSLSNVFIQAGINSFDPIVVEANSVACNSDTVLSNMMNSLSNACTTFVSQNFGAKNMKRVKKAYLICFFYLFATAAVVGCTVAVWGKGFLNLFTPNKEVIDIAIMRLQLMGFTYWLSSMKDASTSALRGIGKSVAPTVIVVFGICVFRIIWIYTIFAYFGTLLSLYLLYSVTWFITGSVETIYFIYSYKKTKRQLELHALLGS